MKTRGSYHFISMASTGPWGWMLDIQLALDVRPLTVAAGAKWDGILANYFFVTLESDIASLISVVEAV